MADILVVILDNDSLTGLKDVQGVPYGGIPDVGAIVVADTTNPDVGGKLWVPTNGIIQIEELEAAMEGYTPVIVKDVATAPAPAPKKKRKTYKTKDTAAEE